MLETEVVAAAVAAAVVVVVVAFEGPGQIVIPVVAVVGFSTHLMSWGFSCQNHPPILLVLLMMDYNPPVSDSLPWSLSCIWRYH